jgi:hypothetical protein
LVVDRRMQGGEGGGTEAGEEERKARGP